MIISYYDYTIDFPNLTSHLNLNSNPSTVIYHLSLNSNPSTVAYRPFKPSYLQTEHTTLPLSGKLAFLFLLY